MAEAVERAADDVPPAGANGDGTSGVLAGAGGAAEVGGGRVEPLDEVCGAGGGGRGGAALVGAGATAVTVGAGATVF